MSKEQNFTAEDNWFKDEKKQLVFDVVDEDAAAQTMTGWTLSFSIYRMGSSAAAILTKTTTGGDIAISNGNGTNDRATVTVAATDLSAQLAGTYQYELERTDASSPQKLAFGTLVLKNVRS